ncbi:MAG: hypothetical protein HOC71_07655 [Candidatus Latescibacteria bacterium]|jgi:hypothetical protein|nr:hypothetical protein [Candidatus Latescibacterota bacterium]
MGSYRGNGASWGDFYNGTQKALRADCTVKTNQYFSLVADMQINDITIGSERFKAEEYGGRFVLDFSTRLSTSSFVQWNNETNEINVNYRLHYIPKIGSDVYVVYNHLIDEDDDYNTLYNVALLKINYTHRF